MGVQDGFVGRFQTGIDLFRPLVAMHCFAPEPAANLLSEVLIPGRSYIFFASLSQLPFVGGSLALSHERVLSIYALDPARFVSEINVTVLNKAAPDGTPRCEIAPPPGKTEPIAVAGVNWQSPGFAELYVHTHSEFRGHNYGQRVLARCTERVLQSGRIPLYLVEPNNEPSVKLALKLGYVDSGARQVMADAVYQGHPGRRL
jgi:GNAT superfamily N-acetyltransferase